MGIYSNVGLTDEGLSTINVEEKVMRLYGLCLCRSLSHVGQITSLLIRSSLLKGIDAVIARWSGLEIRQFTIYQRMVSRVQGI